jgi:hypothetical protein
VSLWRNGDGHLQMTIVLCLRWSPVNDQNSVMQWMILQTQSSTWWNDTTHRNLLFI